MTVEKAIAHMKHRCGKEQCNLLAEDQQAMRVAIDALRQLLDETKWRPIETAPKDGTKVDLWTSGDRRVDCWWEDGTWFEMGIDGFDTWGKCYLCGKPTHWRPLPAPPKEGLCD